MVAKFRLHEAYSCKDLYGVTHKPFDLASVTMSSREAPLIRGDRGVLRPRSKTPDSSIWYSIRGDFVRKKTGLPAADRYRGGGGKRVRHPRGVHRPRLGHQRPRRRRAPGGSPVPARDQLGRMMVN